MSSSARAAWVSELIGAPYQVVSSGPLVSTPTSAASRRTSAKRSRSVPIIWAATSARRRTRVRGDGRSRVRAASAEMASWAEASQGCCTRCIAST